MTRVPLRGRVAAAVLLAGAVSAACGGSGQADPAAAPGGAAVPAFVQADVDFVVHLSQHHSQALHLAELAPSRGRSPEVKSLAADIAAVYAPQVDTLAEWIRAWAQAGAELPAHGIGQDETGPGMVPEGAVTRLEALKGQAFDRQFRVLMARHHRGGLDLVDEQLQGGINPDARALAERLRTAQDEQLAQLK
ncbi:DUF305 domain-containing protein [Sporichthya polymorpha]|uniref:DUF305 domain-containing protein n=1 Tax=Sporichthya polymorpha TaxID=35751 RepID=UPI0003704363|nr:DUF305 domain-containing protein [Sporichthya polymorpha]